jgi:hypothetical protein
MYFCPSRRGERNRRQGWANPGPRCGTVSGEALVKGGPSHPGEGNPDPESASQRPEY